MTIPQRVRLVEVGPRDGLQNEAVAAPVAVRVRLIEMLAEAGLQNIEAGSFVPEKLIPQMAQTGAVLAALKPHVRARISVLAPNSRGFTDAVAAGAKEIAILTAASESFSQRNMNCGIAESLERARALASAARISDIRLRGYISCVLGCPFEGHVEAERVAEIAVELHRLGCDEISLGDTIGVGTPLAARGLVERVAKDVPLPRLAGHFHDTYGQALANVFACLETGLAVFDCSVAGLGGCPFAPGATGNVSTEDVVYMLNGCGVETGVDLDRLLDAGDFICKFLGQPPRGRVALARAAREGALRACVPGQR
ncbi:hydroxymethylglutaryl-CoA lyase [Methylocystis echinoides]|uniref:hydroxymethylglutaryl-CoA lyase n=1 Tax=Methylocystis echinoides TaxID=29468 RepID=UPI00343B7B32